MFGKKKKVQKTYDTEAFEPVIRCSICTGEQVAGFRHRETGKFREDRLIRTQEDLREFMEEYGIPDTPPTIY